MDQLEDILFNVQLRLHKQQNLSDVWIWNVDSEH
jgi:hypothetical protein